MLAALVCGTLSALGVAELPSSWNEQYDEVVDTIWLSYFGTMLALSVAALVLGVRCLVRPAAHPRYPLILGVAMILVGAVGLLLGFAAVGNSVETMGTVFAFGVSGLSSALAGAVTTLLSGIAVADRRRALKGLPAGALPPPNAQANTLGLRFLARLVDSVLVAVVAVPSGLLLERAFGPTPQLLLGLCVGLITFVYFVWFETGRGWTPGKRLLGLRVHGPGGTAKPTLRQSAIRNAFTLLIVVPFMGEFLALIAGVVVGATIHSSPTGQGRHDVFAGGTQVVSPSAPVPNQLL